MRLLIIDGHNLLFRMYYGMPARIKAGNGAEIHGVVGFIGAFLRAARMLSPDRIVVLFDSEQPTARKDEFDGYKNRAVLPGDPFSQLPFIEKALDKMNIVRHECRGIEADDVAASFVRHAPPDCRCSIMSNDADFYQLVNQNTSVFLYNGEKSVLLDADGVYLKTGVSPDKITLFKALCGDKSDTIPGIPGVGCVTAARLANEYADEAELFSRANEIKPAALAQKIADNEQLVRRNLRLVTLDGAAPPPLSYEACSAPAGLAELKTTGVLLGIV